MHLVIPSKLEPYVDQIKNQTMSINEFSKFTLILLGTTQKKKVVKKMYLLFNPFSARVYVDCNTFKKESNVYKIYPGSFWLEPNSAQAFIVFSHTDDEILIDYNVISNSIRKNITSRIIAMNDYEKKGFDVNKIFPLESQEVNFDKTVLLNKKGTIQSTTATKFNNKHADNVDVIIANAQVNEGHVFLSVQVINNSVEHSYEFLGFILKVSDETQRLFVKVKQPFTIKANSKKNLNLNINKENFSKLNMDKVDIKVTLL